MILYGAALCMVGVHLAWSSPSVTLHHCGYQWCPSNCQNATQEAEPSSLRLSEPYDGPRFQAGRRCAYRVFQLSCLAAGGHGAEWGLEVSSERRFPKAGMAAVQRKEMQKGELKRALTAHSDQSDVQMNKRGKEAVF